MGRLVLRSGLALGAALAVAGCAYSPGPGDYAAASSYHARQAAHDQYMAGRDRNAAAWQAAGGDYGGASQAQAAAADRSRSAGWQRFQANKDALLGW